ncbi:MAG: GHKL domain-containing protein, partial [Candidatus Omnitrophica bacterium]|nr:GHKL domain-containing protein [Candidatus Omnitrophota bacterium]
MSVWAIGALINAVVAGFLGALVYSKDRKNETNFSYGLFCLSICIWSLCYFIWQISVDTVSALFWSRALMAAATFIPICYLHHIYSLLGSVNFKRRFLFLVYFFGVFSAVFCFQSSFISSVSPKMVFRFWPNAGPLFLPFLLVWFLIVYLGVRSLIVGLAAQKNRGQKEQIKYVLIATIIGWGGGATNFPLWFDIRFLPVGNILTSIYAGIVAYAIIKYRLMDIRVAVSSAGIFLAVYALTLGIPIFLYSREQHFWALSSMALFATCAPFIYFRLQQRAEDKILREERSYQEILTQASHTFLDKLALNEITKSIVEIVGVSIKAKSAAFYLFDGSAYVLKAVYGEDKGYEPEMGVNHALVSYVKVAGAAHLGELKHHGSKGRGHIDPELKSHPAVVAVPFQRLESLPGVLLLGEKTNQAPYSDRDLNVLRDLAINGTMAILAAIHYEQEKKTFEQQMEEERLKDLGLLASKVAHQMGNRLNRIVMDLSVFTDFYPPEKVTAMPQPKLVEAVADLQNRCNGIIKDALSAAAISAALKRGAKKGAAPMKVRLKDLLDGGRALAEVKHPELRYTFVSEFDDKLTLWVNDSAVQDIFANAIDNSLDAIRIRQEDKACPEGYAGRIQIKARVENDTAVIELEDNGIGIKPDDQKYLFVPLFTTKGTDRGTGLGLSTLQTLVKGQNGDVKMMSEYKAWTKLVITLPIAR